MLNTKDIQELFFKPDIMNATNQGWDGPDMQNTWQKIEMYTKNWSENWIDNKLETLDSEWEPEVGSCESDVEPSGSIRSGEFLN
jgi:hypothetical protein